MCQIRQLRRKKHIGQYLQHLIKAEIREIDFMSAASKNRKINSELNGEEVEFRDRMKTPNVPKPTEKEKEDMQIDVYKAGVNALILSVLARYLKPFIPKILQDGQLLDSHLKPRGERYVGKEGVSKDRLFRLITVTPE